MDKLEPIYLKELNKRKFDYNEPDDQEDYVLTYAGDGTQDPINVAAFSNMIMAIGMPKSRKSLFFDCIMSSVYTDNLNNTLGFKMDLQGRCILHIDTEQPRPTFKKTRKKFVKMCGYDNNLPCYEAFNLRPYTYMERILMIEELLISRGSDIGFLLIDGIVDLCTNENDDESVRNAVATCMRWSDEYNLLLGTVLHTNRGGEMSNGKLGSTMDKKIDTSFRIERDGITKISTATHKLSRQKPIEDLCFRHNQYGYPEFLDKGLNF